MPKKSNLGSSTLTKPRKRRSLKARLWRSRFLPLHLATLVMLVGVGLFIALSLSWLLGNPTITNLALSIHQQQLDPPWFVRVPETPYRQFLIGIFVALVGIILAITQTVPKPTRWTKAIIAGILIALAVRYLFWRILATLNLSNALTGILALTLLFLEIPFVLAGLPQLFWVSNTRNYSKQADGYEIAVKQGKYRPTVDIFIPTYNEPESIVRRTIIGCQAIDYEPKTIYLLDDGQRSPIESLAQELGCNYITRSDRRHYKAGNLNNALQYTQGDLIAVFDADFVPTRNFLLRTVGFFQQPDIGIVQSHQNYYNPDAIVRNLGLAQYLTSNREGFSRYVQPTLDSVGATVCDGSAFVVRRRDLDKIGGFVTESLCEDYFTGILLDSHHQKVIYLDENLSAGLAAESLNDYVGQYQRWLMGSLQAFFIKTNPLTLSGLTLRQRMAHLMSLVYWLTGFPRLLILLVPIICGLASIFPIIITPDDWLYFLFLPHLLLLFSMHWLSDRSTSMLLSEIYTIIHAIPFSLTAVQVFLRPFSRAFQVTPKGFLSDGFRVNAWLTIPLGLLWLGNGGMLVNFLWQRIYNPQGLPAGFADIWGGTGGILVFWWVYNLIFLGLAILACIDPPKPETCEWFKLERPMVLSWENSLIKGITHLVSEKGARVRVNTKSQEKLNISCGDVISMEIKLNEWPGNLRVEGRVTKIINTKGHCIKEIDIKFEGMTSQQYRHLVELLFCRPGQWVRREHPNELITLIALGKRLLRPRFLLNNDEAIDAISIH
ncbi:Cellulose synthase (UDP-forming) [Rippkaea orientalis PCC 8801]|uniref:cellulose synthase (UDP-forming) n=1 Tax=Rippkaea orientalis (strain PCC 8801 / RF-1) TaxID=41431 RepID=B7JY46_RIPO1|nr:glycosyltransferase [Rippkaea orientalis]ACK67148.1 Cellulose synthase (UDP-forming) [Rippkaea orientalis PCC 8801]